jgi:hypothetical protein
VDRKALPAPHAAPVTEVFVPPQSDIEAQLAAIWGRILGVPKVGAKDNFFALGGHSLLAVQAHREIREALGAAKLSITDIFRFPTLQALAKHLDDRPTPPPALAVAPVNDRAEARSDAMARRMAMRGGVRRSDRPFSPPLIVARAGALRRLKSYISKNLFAVCFRLQKNRATARSFATN